jgi:hypothetical protein
MKRAGFEGECSILFYRFKTFFFYIDAQNPSITAPVMRKIPASDAGIMCITMMRGFLCIA